MTPREFARAAATAVLLASRVVAIAGDQTAAAPVFTAEQAKEGRTGYAKSCASCHMPDLSGNNEMPALAGTPFMNMWGARSTKELFDYLSSSMPYGGPSLTTEAYASITAYILQANGASAGSQALSATTAVPISSLIRRGRDVR